MNTTKNTLDEILAKPYTDRTAEETDALRAGLRALARPLSRGARNLLSRIGTEPTAAIRIEGSEDFRISSVEDGGKVRVTTHGNDLLRELLRAGAVTASAVNGIGLLQKTAIGRALPLHY